MFLTPTLEAASARVTAAQLDAAGALLETAWKKDALRWPRRLKPFLASLSSVGRRAFRDLVEKGCQPDALARSVFTTLPTARRRDGSNTTTFEMNWPSLNYWGPPRACHSRRSRIAGISSTSISSEND